MRVAEMGEDGGNWYYVRVEFERDGHALRAGDLLRLLGPDLSLRASPGRFIIEGHAPLHSMPELLEAAGDALDDAGDVQIISVTVESHDYDLIGAPSLYIGT